MKRWMTTVGAALALLVAGCSGQATDPDTATVTVTEPGSTVTKTVTAADAAVSSAGSANDASETFTMRGEFELRSSFTTILDTDCRGSGDFDGIKPGASVTIYSAKGDVLHVGTIVAGKVDGSQCSLPWSAGGIPSGVGPYQYEVSGVGKWAASEMAAKAGSLEQSLG